MSSFSGTFVKLTGGFGEPPTGLEGVGSLRIESSRIVLVGTRRRTRTATAIAASCAFVAMLLTLVALVGVLDSFGGPALPALICILAAFGAYVGTRAILLRALPLQAVELPMDFMFLVRVTPEHGRLVLLTSHPGLSGLTAFDTADSSRLMEELEVARSGARPGYRQGARS